MFVLLTVNSVSWAPHEFGLVLACGSSDGAISIISSTGDGTWDTKKITNAHTVSKGFLVIDYELGVLSGVSTLPLAGDLLKNRERKKNI